MLKDKVSQCSASIWQLELVRKILTSTYQRVKKALVFMSRNTTLLEKKYLSVNLLKS